MITLFTFVMGLTILNDRYYYFSSFLKSIGNAKHLELIIFTNIRNDVFGLPRNVRIVHIDFVQMISTLEEFIGHDLSTLKAHKDFYKVIDLKPFIPAIYSEHFQKTPWIGWLDNDAWFSSYIFQEIDSLDANTIDVIRFVNNSWGNFAYLNYLN